MQTLCLPKSSRLLNVGSKDTSWEELACESPRSGISSSTKFSLNSCRHSGNVGTQRVAPFYLGFLFKCFGDWVGLVHNRLLRSIVSISWHKHWRGINFQFDPLSRVSLSLDVAAGDEDELEKDVEQWLSCVEGVLEVWGMCGRRRRRLSPCSRRSAGFAWRSGCRAQSTARSAGGGRKRRRQGRTGRSRRGESRTQGETHMNMDDKWRDSDLSQEGACETRWTKCDKGLRALNACSSDVHVARVVVHAVVGLMLVLIAHVIVVVFVVEFP